MKIKKVLVIVAHPDDEIIWMGGTLIKNEKWRTEIISLCRGDDKDRAPKFEKVCKFLRAKSYIFNVEDDELKEIPVLEIVKRIRKFTDGKHYDYVFTHGKNGEYGHKRHIDVHNAIIRMVKEKQLKVKKVFFFSYLKVGSLCKSKLNADKIIKLDKNILNMKRELIKDVYGFGRESFEFKSIEKIKRESFDRLR